MNIAAIITSLSPAFSDHESRLLYFFLNHPPFAFNTPHPYPINY